MTELIQVSSAAPTRDSAVSLAQSAVPNRLAAGGQVFGPLASAFWHDDEFGTGEEWQVVLKTSVDRYPDLEKHLVDHHPWANPVIVAVPIVAAPNRYIAWARAATAG